MKRNLLLSAILGLLAPVAFVGCGETAETKKIEEIKTPTGGVKVETSVKETKSGDAKVNP